MFLLRPFFDLFFYVCDVNDWRNEKKGKERKELGRVVRDELRKGGKGKGRKKEKKEGGATHDERGE